MARRRRKSGDAESPPEWRPRWCKAGANPVRGVRAHLLVKERLAQRGWRGESATGDGCGRGSSASATGRNTRRRKAQPRKGRRALASETDRRRNQIGKDLCRPGTRQLLVSGRGKRAPSAAILAGREPRASGSRYRRTTPATDVNGPTKIIANAGTSVGAGVVPGVVAATSRCFKSRRGGVWLK